MRRGKPFARLAVWICYDGGAGDVLFLLKVTLKTNPRPNRSGDIARVGVEPTQGCPRRILSPLRLPIPPPRLSVHILP